jgi:hypothetical protein
MDVRGSGRKKEKTKRLWIGRRRVWERKLQVAEDAGAGMGGRRRSAMRSLMFSQSWWVPRTKSGGR